MHVAVERDGTFVWGGKPQGGKAGIKKRDAGRKKKKKTKKKKKRKVLRAPSDTKKYRFEMVLTKRGGGGGVKAVSGRTETLGTGGGGRDTGDSSCPRRSGRCHLQNIVLAEGGGGGGGVGGGGGGGGGLGGGGENNTDCKRE